MILFDVDFDFFFDRRIGPEATSDVNRRRKWNRDISQWISLSQFIGHFAPAFQADIRIEYVQNHQDVLAVWARWIKAGILTTPFTIIHFDAHSDLYTGRRKDDFFNGLCTAEVVENPDSIGPYAEEDNFLWWPLKFGWTRRIVWVKPDPALLYFLGRQEFSPDFLITDDPAVLDLEERMAGLLRMEDVNHGLLLSPGPKKEYDRLEKRLWTLKYGRPIAGRRFGADFELRLKKYRQVELPPKSVCFMTFALSPRYVPEKADAVFKRLKRHLANDRSGPAFDLMARAALVDDDPS